VIKLKLRNLEKKDKHLLFRWANLKSVIKNSLSKKKITNKVHEKWFNKKIKSKTDILKIIVYKDVPIGVIRLEKKKLNYFISYLITPRYRKKGNAYNSLKIFLAFLKKRNKNFKVIALVKKDNNPSIKIFEKLKFKLIKTQLKIFKFSYKIN